jgi:hypothetical protein
MKIRIGFVIVTATFFSGVLRAQITSGGAADNTVPHACTMTMYANAMAAPPRSTEPYSAVQTIERVQTLSDGTHITHKPNVEKLWRDSQGRTRIESRGCNNPLSDDATRNMVQITDPVAGYRYIIESAKQIAHRILLQPRPPPPPSGGVAPSRESQTPQPTRTEENLGTQEMQGLVVEGFRETTTFPAGSTLNDKPIVVVLEYWRSRDLNMDVLEKTDDPRIDQETISLSNVTRGEPDPSLFQPPPGYTIVDEKAQFTITVGSN